MNLSHPLLKSLSAEKENILKTIREMVEIESPSTEKSACNRMASYIEERLKKLEFEISRISSQNYGDHIQAQKSADSTSNPGIFLLGHFDTVWPAGTLNNRPVSLVKNKMTGPGIYDMKSGIALAIHALEYLQKNNFSTKLPIRMLWNSDEEMGSPTSRKIIETMARNAKYVLVFEPGDLPGGEVNTFRKGVLEYHIAVTGRSAHAGANHDKGLNANHELAHQIIALENLTDYQKGTTINVGVIRGGTRSNVVAESASAEIDIRTESQTESDRMIQVFNNLRPTMKGFQLEVHQEKCRPPLEKHEKVSELYQKACHVAEELGLSLPERFSGGASDGNFTAALGKATLCGIGAVGDGAHAVHEFIDTDWITPRMGIIVDLLQTLD